MDYQCVSARFLFFNGSKKYTIQYNYGIRTWFVFLEETDTNALWLKKIDPRKSKSPNRQEASFILLEYIQKLESSFIKNKHYNL